MSDQPPSGFFSPLSTNFKYEGKTIPITWATTSPSANDPCVKTQAKAKGALIGVALNGVASAGESIDVATEGVFDLSIVASVAMAVGDFVFASIPATSAVCTTTLSSVNSGVIFGQLLQPITASGTITREVRLLQPSHL